MADERTASHRSVKLIASLFATLLATTYYCIDPLEQILSDNEITTIDKETFKGLSSLDFLSLGNNKITAIAKETFKELTSLEYLWLQHNKLTTIPKGLFTGLTSLYELDLSKNKITAIANETFKGPRKLNYVSLDNNTITTIAKGAFTGLTLNWLFIKSNPLVCNCELGEALSAFVGTKTKVVVSCEQGKSTECDDFFALYSEHGWSKRELSPIKEAEMKARKPHP